MDNSWKDKIANYAQLGGIETSILDNGSGKGVRIAWINVARAEKRGTYNLIGGEGCVP